MSSTISPDTMQKQAIKILKKIVPWTQKPEESLLKSRKNYKGSHGRIAIVGGARDYSGAPYFASISAMRLGADLGYVICSQGASQSIKNYSPDLIVVPTLDHPDEEIFRNELPNLINKMHTIVVGPGLGRDERLQARAKLIIEEAKAQSKPLVLDADSLLLVEKDPSIIRNRPDVLLTPNRNELKRLSENLYAPETFDTRSAETSDIMNLVRRCSSDLGVSILAKGVYDVVCDARSNINMLSPLESGSGRRCGGQGDILCGLAGVYCYWISLANMETDDKIENVMAWAGYLAAMTTRRCNELAYAEFKNGMLASNMIDKIAPALESLLDSSDDNCCSSPSRFEYEGLLSVDEIKRYARQMIMSEFGPERQANLHKASALVIGAGGLGCPTAIYLGAGGIGRLGIVDDDRVEASNLHRQILHTTDKIGLLKTESIRQSVMAVNPNVEVRCHNLKMDRYNAVDLVEGYDVIIDCTDNLLTRYMISDACVVAKKPLVSGAALKMDGQLTVYNYDSSTPCFRCLFPEPPPPNAVGSCSDNGVLGVVPGVVGVNQALEAIKVASGLRPAYAGKMLLFDGQLGLFRLVTLGKRKQDCPSCGVNSSLTRQLIDYDELCGSNLCRKPMQVSDVLPSTQRITVEEYKKILETGTSHILVDVRPKEHSDISRFKHAIQLPIKHLLEDSESSSEQIKQRLNDIGTNQIIVICRLGISSQRGAQILEDLLKDYPGLVIKDVIGGMTEWSRSIDSVNFACV